MKLAVTLLISCLSFMLSAQSNRVPNEYIIQLKHTADEQSFLREARMAYPSANVELPRCLSKRFNIWLCTSPSSQADVRLRELQSLNSVAVAQFNHYVSLRATTPNDPSFSQQWSLNNTGQSSGTVGADIDATSAWDITTGGVTATGDSIVVAVIDGGFQLNHPDLIGNYFINRNEIPGNNIDDDNNGYIDDVSGWDAYSNDGVVPSDQHGTHVSGIIGAKGDNNIGIAGVNWNVKILPIAGSSGNESTVVAAYAYAAEMRIRYDESNGTEGAFVVSTNSSFGVDQGDPADYPIWCAFYDTLGAHGILSAGATANANFDIDAVGDIPTACASEFLISVTNSTRTDTKYNGAGYGINSIDIASPGATIYSTVTNSNYSNLTGTSMATPHVAGSIALMYAAACDVLINDYKADPASLALIMKNYLYAGAEQIAAFNGLVAGSRRLNVYGAIQQVQTYVCNAEAPPVANFNANGRTGCPGLTVSFNNNSSFNAESFLWSFPGGTPASSTEEDPTVVYADLGSYNVQLIVTNAFGNDTLDFSNYVEVTNTGNLTVYAETFEQGNLQDMGFQLDNADNANSWDVFSSGGIAGSNYSAGVNIYNNQSAVDQWDYLISPSISLANSSNNNFSLSFAHRRRSTSQADSLVIFASGDDGANWTRLRALGGGSSSTSALATNTLLNGNFTPTTGADWCSGTECISLDLSNWDGVPNFRFRLGIFNDAGNNIYVDNIRIDGQCSIPNILPSVAEFVVPQQFNCTGQPVSIQNTSENATFFEWTFENGNPATSTAETPFVIFDTPGVYAVSLIASNSQFSDTLELPGGITVIESPSMPIVTEVDGLLSATGTGPFQWFFNGTIISGATSSTYQATQNGSYSVQVSNNSCITESESQTVIINGIDSLESSWFEYFPNPAKDYFTIKSSNNESLSYQVRDMLGRLVSSGTFKGQTTISSSEFASGTYFLEVRSAQFIKTVQLVHP